MLGVQHHDDAIGAEQHVAVLVEGLDELVLLRQLLVEAGRHAQLRGEASHHQGHQGQHAEGGKTMTEEEALEAEHQGSQHGYAFLKLPSERSRAGLARLAPAVRTSRRCCRS
ncbi:hypothetical protein D3C75_1116220 [compost metagenome]